jgi:hypothetical protein
MGRACSASDGEVDPIYDFYGKPEANRPLGSPKRRWMGNVMNGVREIRWSVIYWVDLAQDMDR